MPRKNARVSLGQHPAARPLSIGAAVALVILAPTAAHAVSGQAAIVMKKWQAMDRCAIAAQRAFPEFTAEANAKRDAKLKECLASGNLPPRETPPVR